MSYGLDCPDNKDYFIDRCNYDQAGIILQHIYGALQPRNDAEPTGRLSAFDQREFTSPASPASYSLAETGYIYVPAPCAAREPCRVHIALHGCKQNYDAIGDRYIRHAGYNGWADTNHLIILYPQTIAGDPMTNFGTPFNPYGCWDWWGYTDFNYAVKAGRQMAAIKAMLERLTRGHAPNPGGRSAEAAVPTGLKVNDVSDTAVALAWAPLAGVQAYTVYRATDPDQNFSAIGTVAEPSFGDTGLSPATSYAYKVTTSADGNEGPRRRSSRPRHCRRRTAARSPAAAPSAAEGVGAVAGECHHCSALPTATSVASLPGLPTIDRPTGRPSTVVPGMLICGSRSTRRGSIGTECGRAGAPPPKAAPRASERGTAWLAGRGSSPPATDSASAREPPVGPAAPSPARSRRSSIPG